MDGESLAPRRNSYQEIEPEKDVQNSDEGIVTHYLDKVVALGEQSMRGDAVAGKIQRVVDTAFTDFDIRYYGTPEANKLRFLGHLKLRAGVLAHSSPAQASVLMKAHDIAMGKLFIR
ncbi:hypothetical protein [Paraburkholderia sp. C35]|uniref:hypothetical protein n=1 Tax=Paraburkholderia sp. C35 TaxID=2126993 RepID=UPI000D6918A2|nr:hypothetical protein [Paraburkholderia sp. C35]